MWNFRQLAMRGWRWRLLDLAGHIAIAFWLPIGWLQFVPDMWLPILFFDSWITSELLSEESTVLVLHKFFHTLWVPGIFLILAFIDRSYVELVVVLHWTAHVLWDRMTHPEKEFKKALL